MRYSTEPTDWIFVIGYPLLSSAKNYGQKNNGKIISFYWSRKYS